MGHEDMCHKAWKRGRRRRRNLNQVDQYSNAALSRALDLEGTAADGAHSLAHEIHVDLGVGILLELHKHLSTRIIILITEWLWVDAAARRQPLWSRPRAPLLP